MATYLEFIQEGCFSYIHKDTADNNNKYALIIVYRNKAEKMLT